MSVQEVLKEILEQINTGFANTNKRLDEITQRIVQVETTIENTTNVKIQALFEDREIVHSKLDSIANELADIKEQITDHDIKIQVLNNKTKAI
jgi:predicted  nucleic acid-binding Zn-ribbon protein